MACRSLGCVFPEAREEPNACWMQASCVSTVPASLGAQVPAPCAERSSRDANGSGRSHGTQCVTDVGVVRGTGTLTARGQRAGQVRGAVDTLARRASPDAVGSFTRFVPRRQAPTWESSRPWAPARPANVPDDMHKRRDGAVRIPDGPRRQLVESSILLCDTGGGLSGLRAEHAWAGRNRTRDPMHEREASPPWMLADIAERVPNATRIVSRAAGVAAHPTSGFLSCCLSRPPVRPVTAPAR